MEIPLTSITPFRLTLSISYMKLLGRDFFLKLCQQFPLPDTICFSSHLHDFIFNDTSYNNLSFFWKLIFGRNKLRGIDYCIEFLEFIKQKEYHFCYVSEIYNKYKIDPFNSKIKIGEEN